MPSLKPRCTFKECRSAAKPMMGDCGFCDGHYCAKHRLLEDHKCTGLEDVSSTPPQAPVHSPSPAARETSDDAVTTQWWLVGLAEVIGECGLDTDAALCKKESHERNAAQLESERTQVIRGV
ncbi:Uu.00g101370.m01.CDS01 [Anthostomella pinea]|uniref:Uu.00g101370.m01.CDS01 n=1 Tax=Anthostomella pinea TaxID=933095 RepID=A0AAI8YFE9_9PEZI|nr:Uu.00g101370.m01.CDS01 [Anthostomella pinea]